MLFDLFSPHSVSPSVFTSLFGSLCPSAHHCSLPSFREVAKNAMLRWAPFVYWTILGVYQGLLFFFGVRYLFSNPALQDNGQVCKPRSVGPSMHSRDAKAHRLGPLQIHWPERQCSFVAYCRGQYHVMQIEFYMHLLSKFV